MSQNQTIVHDSITETFVPTCRHCKKTADEHAADKCFFDSTNWDPMSPNEWANWRKNELMKLGDVGTNYIREQLRSTGFARSLVKKK